jgi:hypothetical protein
MPTRARTRRELFEREPFDAGRYVEAEFCQCSVRRSCYYAYYDGWACEYCSARGLRFGRPVFGSQSHEGSEPYEKSRRRQVDLKIYKPKKIDPQKTWAEIAGSPRSSVGHEEGSQADL